MLFASRTQRKGAETVGSFREYDTLVARCGAWSVEDLGDLLHEIDRDRALDDRERATLQDRLYRLIWDRAQPRIHAHEDHDGKDHDGKDHDGEGGETLGD